MRRMLIAIGLAWCGWSCRSPESAAIRTVEKWERAVRAGDCPGVTACILADADFRNGPCGDSPEAVAFWETQLEELDRDGFAGDWVARMGTSEGQEVVYVYPEIPNRVSREAIWLVVEAGEWRIGLLFVTPPDEPEP